MAISEDLSGKLRIETKELNICAQYKNIEISRKKMNRS